MKATLYQEMRICPVQPNYHALWFDSRGGRKWDAAEKAARTTWQREALAGWACRGHWPADPEALGLEALGPRTAEDEATLGSPGDSGWPVQQKRVGEAFGTTGQVQPFLVSSV